MRDQRRREVAKLKERFYIVALSKCSSNLHQRTEKKNK